jgi:Transposase DNA-binding
MKPTRLAPLSTEFAEVQLKDERLKKRLACIVDAAEKSPGSSLPMQAGSSAALEQRIGLLGRGLLGRTSYVH